MKKVQKKKKAASANCLMLRHSCDLSLALCRSGKEKKPLASVSTHTGGTIAVWKLALILLAIGAALAGVILSVRALIENSRRKRFLEEDDYDDLFPEYNEDEELPF